MWVPPCLMIFGCIGKMWSLLFCDQMQLLCGGWLPEFFGTCIVGVRGLCALQVLQSEVGEAIPNGMRLMLSSATR